MACRDWDGIPPLSLLQLTDARIANLQIQNDKLTDLLCKVCKKIEIFGYDNDTIDEIPELKKWWEGHKIQDEIEKNKLREKALAKLTDEDKKALGLIK